MKELLNQLQALAAAQKLATPGPWAVEYDEGYGHEIFVDELGTGEKPNPWSRIAEGLNQGHNDGEHDANFLVAARNIDLRALAAYVESLELTLQAAAGRLTPSHEQLVAMATSVWANYNSFNQDERATCREDMRLALLAFWSVEPVAGQVEAEAEVQNPADVKPFLWTDCEPDEYSEILKAYEPLRQKHKWPMEKAYKRVLSRLKAELAAARFIAAKAKGPADAQ